MNPEPVYDTVITVQTMRPLAPEELKALKSLVNAYREIRKLAPGCVVVNPSRNQENQNKRERFLEIWGQLNHLEEGHIVLPEDAAALGELDQLLEEALDE